MQPVSLSGHYLKHFERMQAHNRTWIAGWNFAAFLHSTSWFWYRRMYVWSLLNLVAPLLLLIVFAFTMRGVVSADDVGVLIAAAGIAYLLAVFVLLPLYADSLYLYRLKCGGQAPKPPSLFTAIGAFLLIVIPGWMVYISVEAQIEYQQRARASKGLSRAAALRAPVAEFYANERRLPAAQDAAKFTESEPLEFAKSVGWDAERRAIVVTLGERDGGKRFEMAAVEKDGALEWVCRTIDFEAKYLPASCR